MSCVPPRGAFYAFPRIDVPEGDDVFVKELLLEKHILVVHGSGFGQRPGSKHVRIVFLPQEDVLKQAYSEMRDFVVGRYGN
jgi:alanine-synthesizing transaminase